MNYSYHFLSGSELNPLSSFPGPLQKPLVQQSRIWFLSVLIAEILGGAVGWGIFGAIYQISSPSETLKFALMGLTSGGVSGVLSGLITGRVMLRLLRLKKSPPIA